MLSIMTANAQDALLYSGVQQAEGLTASELFSNCNTWVATSFNSAKDVTHIRFQYACSTGQLLSVCEQSAYCLQL